MKPLKVLKNRSDIGAGTRGSDLRIDALEIAAINASSDFFNRHPYLDIETHNETIYNKVQNTTAKRINFVREQCACSQCYRNYTSARLFPTYFVWRSLFSFRKPSWAKTYL